MTFDDLRAAIEAMPHQWKCRALPWPRGAEFDPALIRVDLCNCGHADMVAALTTLEREHAERERRLREEVLQELDDAVEYEYDFAHYRDDYVGDAHGKLAKILDSSTQTESGKEGTGE